MRIDALVLISVFTFCSSNIIAQRIPSDEKLRVSFEDFYRIDDGKYHPDIELDIASFIKLGLINVAYLNFDATVSIKNGADLKKQYYKSDNTKVSEDPDLIISGSYAIYQNNFIINANIFFTTDRRTVNINPITGNIDKPFAQFELLSKNIIDAIETKRLSRDQGQKKVAIICKAISRNEKTLNLNYYKDLTIKTTRGINEHPQMYLLPWDQSAKYYLSDMPNQEIANQLSVDALLVAYMEMTENGDVKINSEFYLNSGDKRIELGEIWDGYFTEIPFEEELIFRANRFFNIVLKIDGGWNLDPFMKQADNFEDYFDIAFQYYSESQPALSNYYYYKAQKYEEESSNLHYNMAINYVTMDRIPEAKQEYIKAIKYDQSNKNSYLNLFLLYVQDANYEEALKLAQKLEKNIPHDALTYKLLGIGNYYNGDFSAAIEYLEKGIVLTPQDPVLYANLGLSQMADYQDDSALENFRKALEYDPENPDYKYYVAHVMVLKGNELLLNNKYDEALEYLEGSFQYHELDHSADYIRKCYLMKGELEKAKEVFTEFLRKGYYSENKDYYQFALDIRHAFLNESGGYRAENFGRAVIEYAQRHLEAVPNDAFALWVIGNTHTYLGNMEEGLNYLEKAYDLNKTNRDFFLDLTESLLLNFHYDRSERIYNEIFNNKELIGSLSESDRMILKIVHIGNVAAISNRFENAEAKYITDKIEKGYKITGWSFEAFKIWMESSLSGEVKDRLIELTLLMEQNSE